MDPVLITSPDAWELDAHHPDNFEQPTFPFDRSIPISMGKREATLIGYLSPSKGNLWKFLYDAMNTTIQQYWKYAHQYAVQNSLTNSEFYSWVKLAEELHTVDLSDVTWTPPKEFDSRFYYYLCCLPRTIDECIGCQGQRSKSATGTLTFVLRP